jgi:hypothetical protein
VAAARLSNPMARRRWMKDHLYMRILEEADSPQSSQLVGPRGMKLSTPKSIATPKIAPCGQSVSIGDSLNVITRTPMAV